MAFDPVPPRPRHAEENCSISLGQYERKFPPADLLEESESSADEEISSDSDVSIEELANEYFHISLDDDPEKLSELRASSTRSSVNVSTESTDNRVTPTEAKAELKVANEFAERFKGIGHRKIAPQALRAYSLWHEQGFDIPTIAGILRKPPILNWTVVSYLCDALCHLPDHMRSPPERLLDCTKEYQYLPYFKAHRDLLESARLEISNR